MKSLIHELRSLVVPAPAVIIKRGRHRTCDVAFPFRMGAGFAGDVNRTHPFTVEPGPIDSTNPPTAYGQLCVVDATSKRWRVVQPGDAAGTPAAIGVAVRPFPIQQARTSVDWATIGFGSGTPPTSQPIDILRMGYVIVPAVGTPGKGDAVYVWMAVTAGAHIQGGFEAVNPAGNGFLVDAGETTFNGAPDSAGFTEIAFNI